MTINSNGQVTIPAAIRKQYRLTPGTKIEFVVNEDGRVVIIPEKKITRRDLPDLFPTSISLTDEELEEAISHAFRPSDMDQHNS